MIEQVTAVSLKKIHFSYVNDTCNSILRTKTKMENNICLIVTQYRSETIYVFICICLFLLFSLPPHPSQIKSSLLMFVSWVSCLPLKGTSNVHSDETKFPTVFFSVSLWVATFSNSGGSAILCCVGRTLHF